nr:molybdenum ABC transporter ATP-binding protein [Nitratireductor basaltis]
MTPPDRISIALGGKVGTLPLGFIFEAPAHGVTALYGPSGSGKTTLLRAIAGLDRLDGHCHVGGESWQETGHFLPPHRRAIGYVFQEPSLFPHLDVEANLRFSLKRGQRPENEDEILRLLGLMPLLARDPATLSGGERQRVAIGRALFSQPRLLLMDEPLSALDPAARDEILPFLERLHGELALPILYVSHDMREVERLADHLVLVDRGRVIASGPLQALQADPQFPLAGAREAAVTLDAKPAGFDHTGNLLAYAVSGGVFHLPAESEPPASQVRLRIAAGDVSIALHSAADTTILNILPAYIESLRAVSSSEELVVLSLAGEAGTADVPPARLLARVSRHSCERLRLKPGMHVYAQVKGVALVQAS